MLATQNPIEQEGTYPLPEAQQDRFMFTITVGYPSEEDEFRIIESTTSSAQAAGRSRGRRRTTCWRCRSWCGRCPAAALRDPLRDEARAPHAARTARTASRPTPNVPDFVQKYVTWGAGPRAGQYLILAAKARALLKGRPYVAIEDVRAVALPVLRHRIITNYTAEADSVTHGRFDPQAARRGPGPRGVTGRSPTDPADLRRSGDGAKGDDQGETAPTMTRFARFLRSRVCPIVEQVVKSQGAKEPTVSAD